MDHNPKRLNWAQDWELVSAAGPQHTPCGLHCYPCSAVMHTLRHTRGSSPPLVRVLHFVSRHGTIHTAPPAALQRLQLLQAAFRAM